MSALTIPTISTKIDIEIDCSLEALTRSCEYKYQVLPLNTSKFLAAATSGNVDCYWLNILEILQPECVGECYQNITLYKHNASLLVTVVIDPGDRSSDELITKCHLFFGSVNNTAETLSDIDSLFEDILKSAFDEQEIDDVVYGPDSMLTDHKDQLPCLDASEFETIYLNITMEILSAIQDSNQFNKLWEKNEFVEGCERLLSQYFEMTIVITIESDGDEAEDESFVERYLSIIMIIAGCITVVVILYVCYNEFKRRKKWRKLELLTTYIKKPLVVPIAIGEYDKHPLNSALKQTRLQDLTAIDKDIKNIQQLFGDTFNYRVMPFHDNDNIKTHWTKSEVMDLLEGQAAYLDKAIEGNSHDGLIVIISSHGIRGHIVTSDYQIINKDSIHRIFSVKHPSLRDIPGIFMYDCCDGSNDMHRDNHRESAAHKMDKQMSKGNLNSKRQLPRVQTDIYGGDKTIWYKGEPNPDYKLAIISSSNTGFASQMGDQSGSYMITKFTEKMLDNMGKNKLFLNQIFHQIQEELHNDNVQLIEAKYNNKLEYIKFIKNGGKRTDNVAADTIELPKRRSHHVQVDSNDNDPELEELSEEQSFEKKPMPVGRYQSYAL